MKTLPPPKRNFLTPVFYESTPQNTQNNWLSYISIANETKFIDVFFTFNNNNKKRDTERNHLEMTEKNVRKKNTFSRSMIVLWCC